MKNCQPCIAVHDHRQLHQFFSWWTHACKSLSHWYNGKSHTLKILYHLNGSPSVESNLPNVIFLSQGFYEFFNKSIIHHVSFSGLDVSLPFPNVIRNMIPVYSKQQGFFRQPVIWQNIIWLAFIFRWKHQTKAGKVCGTGKVKSTITYPSFQFFRINRECTGIPTSPSASNRLPVSPTGLNGAAGRSSLLRDSVLLIRRLL